LSNQRIVSICPSNTELLDALGLMEQVVGIDDYSDWPPEPVKNLPKLGPDLNIDMEKLQALQPDLVIASLSVPGMEKNVERLEQLGITTLVLNPKSFEDIYTDIRTLGTACHVEDRAEALVAELQGKVERIQERVKQRSHTPKLYWEWWPRPIFTPGNLNWLTPLSELAGAVNVFADKAGDSYTATHEEVIERAPEHMFAVWCGVHADKVKPSMITEREGYDAIPAVQNGQVLVLEEGMYCRPSQRLFDGLEELVKIIHPE
jgi:iron complex transport system substrate-binding protein